MITEFHEKGSLHDYLKRYVLSWPEALHLAATMLDGLAYLHGVSAVSNSLECKAVVAHRDFKSKNVLVKSNLSACIADFGLAIKYDKGKSLDVKQSQVFQF